VRRSIAVALSCLALVLAPLTLARPSLVAGAGLCGNGGGQINQKAAFQRLLGSASNGVDGYIRGSVSNMNDPSNEHILEWVQVASGTNHEWVQIGQAQGCLGACPATPCQYFPYTIHQYAENQCGGPTEPLAGYQLTDLGQVPTPNNPVYVWYLNTGPKTGHCNGQTSYEFGFRTGSWCSNCAPVAIGYMPSSLGYDWAELEVNYLSVAPTVGRTYFGTDNNHAASLSYGLHTYVSSTGSWLVWNFSGTSCDGIDAVWHSLANWYSAYADDGFIGCQ
jgi:hypothetical protein